MAIPFFPSYAGYVPKANFAPETPAGPAPVQKLASLPTPEELAQRLHLPTHARETLPPTQIASPAGVPIVLATPHVQIRGM